MPQKLEKRLKMVLIVAKYCGLTDGFREEMVKKLAVFMLLLMLTATLFADKVLLWKPLFKGDFDRDDKKQISRTVVRLFKKKFNYVDYHKLGKSLYRRLARCGADETCWSDEASDEGFEYAMLFSFKLTEDEEVKVHTLLISIEDEEIIGDEVKIFDDIEEVTPKALYRVVKKTVMDVYPNIKRGKHSSRDAELAKRKAEMKRRERLARERERKMELERQRREEARRRKLEQERRRREAARRKRLEAERKKREEAARRKRIAEEKKRRQMEEERRRLEIERRKREAENRKKKEAKRAKLRKNADKLSRARELVLEWVQEGKYEKAVKAITKISKIKCECEEDAKILALKTLLLNFHDVVKKILDGVKLLNSSLILDNIEAAKALDQELVEGGTSFSEKVDKYYAVGYYARGLEAEKKDNYILANESFEKCIEHDPDKQECQEWLDNKDKIVAKLYKKASVMKNFNPTKAKQLFRSILRLVTADHDYYKKAEKALQDME